MRRFVPLLGSIIALSSLAGPAASGAEQTGLADALGPQGCRALTHHEPAPGVAYAPGRDVYGRPVAPADLPAETAPLDLLAPPPAPPPPSLLAPGPQPDQVPVVLPLTLDLAGALGLGPWLDADVPLGTLTILGGQVLVDGRPLPGSAAAPLVEACRARYR